MRVKVCGCYGGETRETALTGFVLDETLAIDAGSLARSLSLSEQLKIESILITHTHLDHIRDLGFLADNVIGVIKRPIHVWGTQPTIDVIKGHFFNDKIWPDFSKLPTADNPTIEFHVIEEEKPFEVGNYTVYGVRTAHPVPNTAYLVRNGEGTFCFSGDTGVTDRLWDVINREHRDGKIIGLITEVSFTNDMTWLADVSGHLTPKQLGEQLSRLESRDYPVFLSHMKPNFVDKLKAEVEAEGLTNYRFLHVGDLLELG